jgi:hypothetical protein
MASKKALPPIRVRKPPPPHDLEAFVQGKNLPSAPEPKGTRAQEHKSTSSKPTSRGMQREKARSERGKGMIARRDGTTVRRVVAYLAADVGVRLVVHCAERGEDVSAVVEAAVIRWLAHAGDRV